LGIEGAVPDPSTFSKNRYGRFRDCNTYRILFEEVVDQCRAAGLVPGEGFAVDGSFVHGAARRDLRVETVDAIRQANASTSAGNPAHQGGAKHLSPTDPAAAWNQGRARQIPLLSIDTAHAVIVDVEATAAWCACLALRLT
jgi:hypothetical protein